MVRKLFKVQSTPIGNQGRFPVFLRPGLFFLNCPAGQKVRTQGDKRSAEPWEKPKKKRGNQILGRCRSDRFSSANRPNPGFFQSVALYILNPRPIDMTAIFLSRAFSASRLEAERLPGLRAIDSCLIDFAPPFANLSQAVGLVLIETWY